MGYFSSLQPRLCNNKFVSMEFLERGFQISLDYITTDLFRSPAELKRWRVSLLGRLGSPFLREQLCPLKQEAAFPKQ